MDPRHQVSPRAPDGSRRRTGLYIGSMRVTPTRAFLAVAFVGSMLYLVYAVNVRDTTQIPALSSGALVLGLVFATLATVGGIETFRASRDNRPARSVLAAVLGGIAGVIALGCFAAAAILSMLAKGP